MSELLGRLERRHAREVWRDEARDFTRWLRENIHLLGEELRLGDVLAPRIRQLPLVGVGDPDVA